jgi:hypothetical protein
MSDGLFFTFVIGFFFVLWVASGGPSRPISFSGAYITPITNVNTTQTGYGPQLKLGGTISASGVSASVGDSSGAGTSSGSGDSVYKNLITITRTTAPNSTDPTQKYVHLLLTSQDTAPVRISQWRFVSLADSATVIISNEDASLAPDTSTIVVTSFPASTPHDTIDFEDSGGKLVNSFTY